MAPNFISSLTEKRVGICSKRLLQPSHRYQQLALTQAAAESGNSVITSIVVVGPATKAKPKTTMAKSFLFIVLSLPATVYLAEVAPRTM
jgi:hypothetical protein